MDIVYYIVSALVVVNVIVFVHEFGHYLAAKSVGAAVTTFSIGMGPELFGFTDKSGTRWCFSMFPVGGYVMMLGDGDIASATQDEKALEGLSEKEKSKSITRKSPWQQMLVAFMGPAFNYIYAFIVLIAMSFFYGMPVHQATVGKVLPDSPAAQVGFMEGDRIVSISGKNVDRFRDVLVAISESNNEPMDIVVERGNEMKNFAVTPKIVESKSWYGSIKKKRLLGISSGIPKFEKKPFGESVVAAYRECVSITKEMFHMFGKLFSGKQSLDNFGGVVRMGQIAGDLSKTGNLAMLIFFTVTLSINLGFINLIPLPVLDGGRIVICLLEKIIGRKLNEKAQEYVMMIFAILLISLMVIMTVNDIMRLETVNKLVMKFVR